MRCRGSRRDAGYVCPDRRLLLIPLGEGRRTAGGIELPPGLPSPKHQQPARRKPALTWGSPLPVPVSELVITSEIPVTKSIRCEYKQPAHTRCHCHVSPCWQQVNVALRAAM